MCNQRILASSAPLLPALGNLSFFSPLNRHLGTYPKIQQKDPSSKPPTTKSSRHLLQKYTTSTPKELSPITSVHRNLCGLLRDLADLADAEGRPQRDLRKGLLELSQGTEASARSDGAPARSTQRTDVFPRFPVTLTIFKRAIELGKLLFWRFWGVEMSCPKASNVPCMRKYHSVLNHFDVKSPKFLTFPNRTEVRSKCRASGMTSMGSRSRPNAEWHQLIHCHVSTNGPWQQHSSPNKH